MREKEGSPSAHGPLIKMFIRGAREGAKNKRQGGMEGGSGDQRVMAPINNKASVEQKKKEHCAIQ